MAARWLKPREVAEALAVDVRTVTRWCARGEIPARKFGKVWRIRPDYMKEERDEKK